MQLYQAYRPLTAAPGISRELPPCAELAPYIRCFWAGNAAQPSLIVPDTCADLIFHVDTASGAVQAYFCGVNDAPFTSGAQLGSTFGIRFYTWAAVLFAAEDMRATRNNNMEAEQYFPTLARTLAPMLPYTPALADRAALATPLLLAALRPKRADSLVAEAIGLLLAEDGAPRTASLAAQLHISRRQLERVFDAQTGLTPKAAAGLIRYQCLWQTLRAQPGMPLKTAAARFGYADQAHLQHEFKRYHSMTPAQALSLVRAHASKPCAAR